VGGCPEMSTAKPAHNPQKPLKINVISMSRRHHVGLFAEIEAESRGPNYTIKAYSIIVFSPLEGVVSTSLEKQWS